MGLFIICYNLLVLEKKNNVEPRWTKDMGPISIPTILCILYKLSRTKLNIQQTTMSMQQKQSNIKHIEKNQEQKAMSINYTSSNITKHCKHGALTGYGLFLAPGFIEDRRCCSSCSSSKLRNITYLEHSSSRDIVDHNLFATTMWKQDASYHIAAGMTTYESHA